MGHACCVGVGLWLFAVLALRDIRQWSETQSTMVATEALEHARASLPGIAGAQFFSLGLLTLAWIVLLETLIVYLVMARFRERIRSTSDRSSNDHLRQVHQLARAQDAMIFALAKLADSRDPETGQHLERITVYSRLLAEAAQRHPKYAHAISAEFVRLIHLTAALHDIGKVGIPDRILEKTGPLTPEEYQCMKQHTAIAGACLADLARRVGNSPLLQMARDIAEGHHEHWDGSGYPNGLQGAQIPLAARIVALVDVYDALASKRSYKPSFTPEECAAQIRELAGHQFDPDLVEVFLTIERDFASIATRHAEPVSTLLEVPQAGAAEPGDAEFVTSRPADICGSYTVLERFSSGELETVTSTTQGEVP